MKKQIGWRLEGCRQQNNGSWTLPLAHSSAYIHTCQKYIIIDQSTSTPDHDYSMLHPQAEDHVPHHAKPATCFKAMFNYCFFGLTRANTGICHVTIAIVLDYGHVYFPTRLCYTYRKHWGMCFPERPDIWNSTVASCIYINPPSPWVPWFATCPWYMWFFLAKKATSTYHIQLEVDTHSPIKGDCEERSMSYTSVFCIYPTLNCVYLGNTIQIQAQATSPTLSDQGWI